MSVNSRSIESADTVVSFADVAHQSLLFDRIKPSDALILRLIDTRWVQRLRQIRQTGNTHFVYMFSEHSRFGHSLGVAYLANLLMDRLSTRQSQIVAPFRNAVAAAALLHDIGHVAPGSHLAERIWDLDGCGHHETVTNRVIQEDPEIQSILQSFDSHLSAQVVGILENSPSLPSWTKAIISGGGWNADRGNWAIVDSAMCAVSYGRYNVQALVDAFRLSDDGQLVLHESRLDALTHFFVARDSMYRQVYQHRVLQSADTISRSIVQRLRDLLDSHFGDNIAKREAKTVLDCFHGLSVFVDDTMVSALLSANYARELHLQHIANMTEPWWHYHVQRWCDSGDEILRDLSRRQRDRILLKTVRLDRLEDTGTMDAQSSLVQAAQNVASELGFDPRYYVQIIDSTDRHRKSTETPPLVLLDSGQMVPVVEVEPIIAQLSLHNEHHRKWIAVPKEVKERLNRRR